MDIIPYQRKQYNRGIEKRKRKFAQRERFLFDFSLRGLAGILESGAAGFQ
jgi:hypothetical protein